MNPIEKYNNAVCERLEQGHESTHDTKEKIEKAIETEKKIQEAIYECLDQYAKGNLENIPRDMALEIAHSMKAICGGITPPLFNTHRKRGDKSQSPDDISDIKDAVKYVLWVRAGLISDKSPNKTVREAFKVGSGTVRGWVRNKKYKSDIPNIKYVTENDRKIVTILAISSGYYYSHSSTSPSQEAIKKRAAKR